MDFEDCVFFLISCHRNRYEEEAKSLLVEQQIQLQRKREAARQALGLARREAAKQKNQVNDMRFQTTKIERLKTMRRKPSESVSSAPQSSPVRNMPEPSWGELTLFANKLPQPNVVPLVGNEVCIGRAHQSEWRLLYLHERIFRKYGYDRGFNFCRLQISWPVSPGSAQIIA